MPKKLALIALILIAILTNANFAQGKTFNETNSGVTITLPQKWNLRILPDHSGQGFAPQSNQDFYVRMVPLDTQDENLAIEKAVIWLSQHGLYDMQYTHEEKIANLNGRPAMVVYGTAHGGLVFKGGSIK